MTIKYMYFQQNFLVTSFIDFLLLLPYLGVLKLPITKLICDNISEDKTDRFF